MHEHFFPSMTSYNTIRIRIIFIVPNDSNPESNALSPSTVEWTKRKFL